MKPVLKISETKSQWVQMAIQGIAEVSQQAIADRGKFSLVLSGGSTPAPIYEALGKLKLDWKQSYIFWGDERCVPPDHAESNYKMAVETLLKNAPIHPENIFRIKGEEDPTTAARLYEIEIWNFFAGEEPRFDLVLLGLGEDGHIASLFPGTPALAENSAWAIENQHPTSGMWRISLTYPTILSARNIFFLVQGNSKADITADIILNPQSPPNYPAKKIDQADGNIVWYLDKDAAASL
jgi:6-phosphogluconolactonase